MKLWRQRTLWLALETLVVATRFVLAQAPLARICGESRAPACTVTIGRSGV
jgi:hypothetical protein